MNQKMLSDLVIAIGVILVVVGWGGKDTGGVGSIVSYLMIAVGLVFTLLGLYRYIGGHHQRKE